MLRRILCLSVCLLQFALSAAETWPAALSRMPLGTNVTELNRTNCVGIMLCAFQRLSSPRMALMSRKARNTLRLVAPCEASDMETIMSCRQP